MFTMGYDWDVEKIAWHIKKNRTLDILSGRFRNNRNDIFLIMAMILMNHLFELWKSIMILMNINP